MKCEKCNEPLIFTNTDKNNGLIGYWQCECSKGISHSENHYSICKHEFKRKEKGIEFCADCGMIFKNLPF